MDSGSARRMRRSRRWMSKGRIAMPELLLFFFMLADNSLGGALKLENRANIGHLETGITILMKLDTRHSGTMKRKKKKQKKRLCRRMTPPRAAKIRHEYKGTWQRKICRCLCRSYSRVLSRTASEHSGEACTYIYTYRLAQYTRCE